MNRVWQHVSARTLAVATAVILLAAHHEEGGGEQDHGGRDG